MEIDWKFLGLRMHDIRTQRRISLRQLKEMTGCSDTHLSNIEHNRSHPSLENLVAIVTALDVSLDYIVRGIRPLAYISGLVFRSDDELEKRLFLTAE